jgi:hypothetical protein
MAALLGRLGMQLLPMLFGNGNPENKMQFIKLYDQGLIDEIARLIRSQSHGQIDRKYGTGTLGSIFSLLGLGRSKSALKKYDRYHKNHMFRVAHKLLSDHKRRRGGAFFDDFARGFMSVVGPAMNIGQSLLNARGGAIYDYEEPYAMEYYAKGAGFKLPSLAKVQNAFKVVQQYAPAVKDALNTFGGEYGAQASNVLGQFGLGKHYSQMTDAEKQAYRNTIHY